MSAARSCILIDDMVDSAGTLCNAAVGADRGRRVGGAFAYVTHGVLSGGAVARVTASPIEALVMTDSIIATEAVREASNIRQVIDRAADRGGDPPDQRGALGLQPVRLNLARLRQAPAIASRRACARAANAKPMLA